MTLDNFRELDRKLRNIEAKLVETSAMRKNPTISPYLQWNTHHSVFLTDKHASEILDVLEHSLLLERDAIKKELSGHLV